MSPSVQSAAPAPETADAPATQAASTQERFAFGRNWQRFLASMNEERIRVAEESLCSMLQAASLAVAKPDDVIDACCGRGFVLTKFKSPQQPKGNNEYVFTRIAQR